MGTGLLERLAEEVRALTPDEQRRLRDILDHALADELNRRLLARGIIREIPPPLTDFTRHRSWKPIVIQGKPLSETVIEDRR